jgi:hypothetical protein
MPLLRSRTEKPVAEVQIENEEDFDVLSLRRVSEHPGVRPMIERRAALRQRLEGMEQQRRDILADIARIEARQGTAIAELGEQWHPPLEWRQGKEGLQGIDDQARMIQAGLVELDGQIETASDAARDDIEHVLNTLERPHVEAIVELYQKAVPHNHQLHIIQARRQRLLGHSKWHLFDGGLPAKLRLIEGTRDSLARGASDGGEG